MAAAPLSTAIPTSPGVGQDDYIISFACWPRVEDNCDPYKKEPILSKGKGKRLKREGKRPGRGGKVLPQGRAFFRQQPSFNLLFNFQ